MAILPSLRGVTSAAISLPQSPKKRRRLASRGRSSLSAFAGSQRTGPAIRLLPSPRPDTSNDSRSLHLANRAFVHRALRPITDCSFSLIRIGYGTLPATRTLLVPHGLHRCQIYGVV